MGTFRNHDTIHTHIIKYLLLQDDPKQAPVQAFPLTSSQGWGGGQNKGVVRMVGWGIKICEHILVV